MQPPPSDGMAGILRPEKEKCAPDKISPIFLLVGDIMAPAKSGRRGKNGVFLSVPASKTLYL